MFPDYTSPIARPHTYPGFVSTPLQEVKKIGYLGLSLDPMLTLASIKEKANKGHSLPLAVSYSLRYDKHNSNPTLCHLPVKMLNLWKSCALQVPHFLLYLRYMSDASEVQVLQANLNRSLSTSIHVYGHPTALLDGAGIPPFTLHRTYNLHNSELDCTPLSLPPFFNISLATLAAFTVSCAPQHTRNTHADCIMPRGYGRGTVTLLPP